MFDNYKSYLKKFDKKGKSKARSKHSRILSEHNKRSQFNKNSSVGCTSNNPVSFDYQQSVKYHQRNIVDDFSSMQDESQFEGTRKSLKSLVESN